MYAETKSFYHCKSHDACDRYFPVSMRTASSNFCCEYFLNLQEHTSVLETTKGEQTPWRRMTAWVMPMKYKPTMLKPLTEPLSVARKERFATFHVNGVPNSIYLGVEIVPVHIAMATWYNDFSNVFI